MTTSLSHLLDEQIKSERKDYKPKAFSPSSAGTCYRKRYWQRINQPQSNPPDARTLRKFKVGQLHHDYLQDKLAEMGILLEREYKISDTYRRGRIDTITKVDGGIVIDDIKSVQSKKFWYLAKQNQPDFLPIFQIVTYWDMLPEGHPYKNAQLRILYISKDDLALEEVVIRPQDWIQSVRQDWDEMIGFWERGELPPAEPKFGWECKYCNFRDLCKETK